jgi:hypothetical protein
LRFSYIASEKKAASLIPKPPLEEERKKKKKKRKRKNPNLTFLPQLPLKGPKFDNL